MTRHRLEPLVGATPAATGRAAPCGRVRGRVHREAHTLDDASIGKEARVSSDDHLAVKTWLRLLACSTQIEQAIRSQLRHAFATTLPRFDYLAQLERHPGGLHLKAMSRYLMVTGGNVTGMTTQLVREGLVTRTPDPADGRSARVSLTPRGRREFMHMARAHEVWLTTMFDGFGFERKEALYTLLGQLRLHLVQRDHAHLTKKVR